MQLVSKLNKGIRFSLYIIGIFGKYAWAIPLKVKKGITTTTAFQKILDASGRRPNKINVGSEFYNK